MERNSVRYTFAVLFLFFLGTAPLNAQTGSAGQGGEFLRYGVGARALAMGRAFTALANDASSVYWNPAGLGYLNRWQLAAMHTQLFADTRYQYLAVAGPLFSTNRSRLTHNVGLGIINLASDDFDARNSFNVPTGTFGTQDLAILIPYSVNVVNSWGSFNLGVSPQFYSKEVQGTSGNGVGFDVGFLWQPFSPPRPFSFLPLKSMMAWRLGVNFRALSSVKLLSLEQDYPNSLNIGISNVAFEDVIDLLLPGEPISDWPVKMAVALEHENFLQSKRESEVNFGTEISLRLSKWLVLAGRYGYRFGRTNLEDNTTFGLGLKTDGALWQDAPLLRGLSIDFANVSHPQLGNTRQVFFSVNISDWRRDVMRHRKEPIQSGPPLTAKDMVPPALNGTVSDSLAPFDSLSGPRLLALLGQYSSDDRVISDRDPVDGRYKDEVAWRLSSAAAKSNNDFLRKRYDDFIKGLSLLAKIAETTFEKVKQYHLSLKFGDTKRQESDPLALGLRKSTFDSLKKEFEQPRFKQDLFRDKNRKYLYTYLDVLIFLGGAENCEQVSKVLDDNRLSLDLHDVRLRRGYISESVEEIEAAIRAATSSYDKAMLSLRKAVILASREDSDAHEEAREALQSCRTHLGSSQHKSIRPEFIMKPFLCDGVLADDIRFVEIFVNADNISQSELANQLIQLGISMPHTDLGKALLKHRNRIRVMGESAANGAIIQLGRRYYERFRENQQIDRAIFNHLGS